MPILLESGYLEDLIKKIPAKGPITVVTFEKALLDFFKNEAAKQVTGIFQNEVRMNEVANDFAEYLEQKGRLEKNKELEDYLHVIFKQNDPDYGMKDKFAKACRQHVSTATFTGIASVWNERFERIGQGDETLAEIDKAIQVVKTLEQIKDSRPWYKKFWDAITFNKTEQNCINRLKAGIYRTDKVSREVLDEAFGTDKIENRREILTRNFHGNDLDAPEFDQSLQAPAFGGDKFVYESIQLNKDALEPDPELEEEEKIHIMREEDAKAFHKAKMFLKGMKGKEKDQIMENLEAFRENDPKAAEFALDILEDDESFELENKLEEDEKELDFGREIDVEKEEVEVEIEIEPEPEMGIPEKQ